MLNRISKLFIILICCASMLTSCYVYGGSDRPPNHPGTSVWVCEEPHIEFTIEQNNVDNYYLGTIYKDDVKIPCKIIFDLDPTVYFYVTEGNVEALRIRCKYEKDMFTATVEEDNIFNGMYKKLVFVKDRIIEDKMAPSTLSY